MAQVPYFRIIPVHGITSLAMTAVVALLLGQERAMSFFLGALLIWLNWLILGLSWRQVLGKKPIALMMGIIVIKYPLFGVILISAVRQPWFNTLWFAAGVTTVIPAGWWLALKSKRSE